VTRVSRGTINRKVWKYCETHQAMVLKKGPCTENKCKGKIRERYEYCFTYIGVIPCPAHGARRTCLLQSH
jgi:hypothetical protein